MLPEAFGQAFFWREFFSPDNIKEKKTSKKEKKESDIWIVKLFMGNHKEIDVKAQRFDLKNLTQGALNCFCKK